MTGEGGGGEKRNFFGRKSTIIHPGGVYGDDVGTDCREYDDKVIDRPWQTREANPNGTEPVRHAKDQGCERVVLTVLLYHYRGVKYTTNTSTPRPNTITNVPVENRKTTSIHRDINHRGVWIIHDDRLTGEVGGGRGC